MLPPRVIPCLLLQGRRLVKTRQFKAPVYLGDPCNAVRIFNEKEVDELTLLDIEATAQGREPDYAYIEELAGEAFMPIAYGGGIRTVEQAHRVMGLGVEKVVLNTAAFDTPQLVSEIAGRYGSQSVVVCMDVRRGTFGGVGLYAANATRRIKGGLEEWAAELASLGAGELLVQAVDRDSQMEGYDLELIRRVASSVRLPVIGIGGAGNLGHLREGIAAGASAVAAGSMFVFTGRHRAVLITYPSPDELSTIAGVTE